MMKRYTRAGQKSGKSKRAQESSHRKIAPREGTEGVDIFSGSVGGKVIKVSAGR